ncbi:cytochrome P450, partial [Sistotremastrum niveocremeum HHB9708]
YLSWKSRRNALPPGPSTRFPFWGRLKFSERKWEDFTELAKKYGPVFHYRDGQTNYVVLNSPDAIFDLLNKRSRIYSDRPQAYVSNMLGQNKTAFRTRSDSRFFHVHRRMFNDAMGPRSVHEHFPLLEKLRIRLLGQLLSNPHDFIEHIKMSAGSAVLKMAYGYDVRTKDDDFLVSIMKYVRVTSTYGGLGMWAVDHYPFLKYMPRGFPGTSYRKFVEEFPAKHNKILHRTTDWVKAEMAAGRAVPSFVSKQLGDAVDILDEEHEDHVRHAAAGMYLGAADTTPGVLMTFFLCMTLFPEPQRRAQEEINRVIGKDRLPVMADRDDLPYVNALIKECLRWHPVAPLGLVHSVTEDDEYNGMLIPKGSTIIANLWGLSKDEQIYPDPWKFQPERYITDSNSTPQMELREWVFGFGRRICPGQYFAEASLFISVASVLAMFDISKPVDSDGKDIVPDGLYGGGTTSLPLPFECCIVPRNDTLAEIIGLMTEK